MSKKYLFLIIIFLIVGGVFFSIVIDYESNVNKIVFEHSTFSMPEGFYQQENYKTDKYNFVNLSDGSKSLGIYEYGLNSNVNDVVQNYVNAKKNKENVNVDIVNVTFNNKTIYKSLIENDQYTVHYWFSKNNTAYEVYTWNSDSNTENIVKSLVS